MSYWVIGAIILALGVGGSWALRRGLVQLGLGLAVLETEARKARDKARENQR
jgi:hypothetical protein